MRVDHAGAGDFIWPQLLDQLFQIGRKDARFGVDSWFPWNVARRIRLRPMAAATATDYVI
jgi:hypothetical protein